eukprot:c6733_g1_i1.p1 GENE.c6733_g1_i1~~c6733_g1_i1.p1  ORF type:complete len:151 (+),score=27.63 c6733_g1_i1:41-493(+)
MNPACTKCSKTVYATEKILAGNKPYHKLCLKCTECSMALNVQNVVVYKEAPYCKAHVPVERKGTGGDSVATQNAMKAPKPVASGVDWQSAGAKAAGANPNKAADTGYSADAPAAADQGTYGGDDDVAPADDGGYADGGDDSAPPADEQYE